MRKDLCLCDICGKEIEKPEEAFLVVLYEEDCMDELEFDICPACREKTLKLFHYKKPEPKKKAEAEQLEADINAMKARLNIQSPSTGMFYNGYPMQPFDPEGIRL